MNEKLLIPGWAGDISAEEINFIRTQLKESASLRRDWCIGGKGLRISANRIRRRAMEGVGLVKFSAYRGHTPPLIDRGEKPKKQKIGNTMGRAKCTSNS